MPVHKPRVALVYMPFGASNRPALGVSLLKSALARQGIPCDIHYLNLVLANELGTRMYDSIALRIEPDVLVGDWLFAPSLFGENSEADRDYVQQVLWGDYREIFTPIVVHDLLRIRERIPAFLDTCIEKLDWQQYDWVGFSTSFQQNCASLALAQQIKSRYPTIRIVFGGANCFGGMGAALWRLFPFVNYVCIGYADKILPTLVQAVANGDPAPSIPGIVPCEGSAQIPSTPETAEADDLNALPYPDYSDYFEQLKAVHTSHGFDMFLTMEASRGCWWGEKRQCTFCGLNNTELTFRCKSPERVLAELRHLREHYGNKIFFVDNILAQSFFQSVLPALVPGQDISLGLEVRANLRLDQVMLLANAGVESMQAGIESLSDPILRLIRKGTTLVHNIQVLKWAKQFGIWVSWNLLWGFPGEDPAEYVAMQALMSKLTHLDSPVGYGRVRFDRFSAYWADPTRFGITSLRPTLPYRTIYHPIPEDDLQDLANYFDADYTDVSASYAQGMEQAVKTWQASRSARLDVFPSGNTIQIVDTRKPGTRHEYNFNGNAAELYLRCDAAQTVHALMQDEGMREPNSEAEVLALLDQFVTAGLMVRSGRQYLSLAVLREGRSSEL